VKEFDITTFDLDEMNIRVKKIPPSSRRFMRRTTSARRAKSAYAI
jgi:hypothetical protein